MECFVTRRRLKIILPLIPLGAILAGLLFSAYATTANAPGWLRMVSVEIQAACRDAGTQWMVVVCLVSYLGTFFFLEKRADRSWKLGVGKNESNGQRPKAKVEDQETELPTSNAQRSTSKVSELHENVPLVTR